MVFALWFCTVPALLPLSAIAIGTTHVGANSSCGGSETLCLVLPPPRISHCAAARLTVMRPSEGELWESVCEQRRAWGCSLPAARFPASNGLPGIPLREMHLWVLLPWLAQFVTLGDTWFKSYRAWRERHSQSSTCPLSSVHFQELSAAITLSGVRSYLQACQSCIMGHHICPTEMAERIINVRQCPSLDYLDKPCVVYGGVENHTWGLWTNRHQRWIQTPRLGWGSQRLEESVGAPGQGAKRGQQLGEQSCCRSTGKMRKAWHEELQWDFLL